MDAKSEWHRKARRAKPYGILCERCGSIGARYHRHCVNHDYIAGTVIVLCPACHDRVKAILGCRGGPKQRNCLQQQIDRPDYMETVESWYVLRDGIEYTMRRRSDDEIARQFGKIALACEELAFLKWERVITPPGAIHPCFSAAGAAISVSLPWRLSTATSAVIGILSTNPLRRVIGARTVAARIATNKRRTT